MSRDLQKHSPNSHDDIEEKDDAKLDMFHLSGQMGLPGDDNDGLNAEDYALNAPSLTRDLPSLDGPVFRGLATTAPASDLLPHMSMPSLHQPSSHMKGLDLGSDPFAETGMFSNNSGMSDFFKGEERVQHSTKEDYSLSYGMGNLSLDQHELLPPLAMGGYLEPYYHFYSTAAPGMILEQLHAALRDLHENPEQLGELDFEVKPAKFKIKCEAYAPNGSKIPFAVRVFRLEDRNDRFAIEFQRRKGDPMSFCAIYRNVYNKLSGIIEPNESENVHPLNDTPVEPVDVPSASPVNFDSSMGEQTLKCLSSMIKSGCIDVQSEALNALVPLTTILPMAKAICESECFDLLVSHAASEYEEVHRSCLTALANVLELVPDRCSHIVAVPNHRMLLQRACSRTRHVVRETTRVLLAVCKQVPQFDGQAALMHSLQRALEGNSDQRVRSSWDQIGLRWGS